MLTLYQNLWQKKAKTNSNNSNNNKKWNKIKPETKTTVKVKMVKKLCA